MPFPMMAAMLISALGGAASSIGGAKAASGSAKQQQETAYRQMGLEESQLNPFRGANAQARSLIGLDRTMNRTPTAMTAGPGGYQQLTGGQYQVSPEVLQWLTELRARIASGDAANPVTTVYGKPQVGNLTQTPSMRQQDVARQWARFGTLNDHDYKPR